MLVEIFENRKDAGYQLADKLISFKNDKNTIVLGIPRGGVITAWTIAQRLSLPLGIVVVRKIGHPSNPEYAIASISESGLTILNPYEFIDTKSKWFKQASKLELIEVKRRKERYWGKSPYPEIANKTLILVDDGLATGLTMEMAIKELKSKKPSKIVIATPFSPRDTAEKLQSLVNQLFILTIPDIFAGSVGAYYRDFPQVEDEEVISILAKSKNIK